MSAWKQKATSGGGNFECCPAGNHPAVLIGLIDLGTQSEQFPGQERRDVRKVFLCWEVPGEKTESGRSHVIGREYTLSFHEKAGLRQMIEAWRGKAFQEGEAFDIDKLLGQPCLLQVLNEEKNGKVFGKIKGLGALPKGMAKPVATLERISFSMEDDDILDFPDPEWLPWSFGSRLIDIAKLSPEYQSKATGKPVEKPKEKPPTAAAKKEAVKEAVKELDEIPF